MSSLITFFRKPKELLTISHQSLVHTTAHEIVFSVHLQHVKMAQNHLSDLSGLWVSSQRVKHLKYQLLLCMTSLSTAQLAASLLTTVTYLQLWEESASDFVIGGACILLEMPV